jgi:hypothetical protein
MNHLIKFFSLFKNRTKKNLNSSIRQVQQALAQGVHLLRRITTTILTITTINNMLLLLRQHHKLGHGCPTSCLTHKQ